jgi:type IV secretion system protein VirD4
LYESAWETFISNAGVIQTFGGSNDNFTSEYLSNMTGSYTVSIKSTSEQQVGVGGSITHSETKRPGLMPHEIATLNAKPGDKLRQVLFFSGHGYTFAQRLLHYTDFPDYMAFYGRTPHGIRNRVA